MMDLSRHDFGVVHLGYDGVLRSFHPNGTVLAYVQLSSNQIQYLLDRHGRDEYLDKIFEGVSGHAVKNNSQLLHPAEHLMPEGFEVSEWKQGTLSSPHFRSRR